MEKGYQGASLDDVARHMGATKGRIYHYFGSKSELMHAVRKRAMDINFAAILPAYESGLPPVERFAAMARAHAVNMIANRAYQTALFDSLYLHLTRGQTPRQDVLLDEFLADRRAFEDMFREVLQEGLKAGVFDVKTPSYALHTALSTLNSTLYWYTPRTADTQEDWQAVAAEQVQMALRALGACNPENKEN